MEKNIKLDNFFTEYLRPASFPLAVRFLQDEPLPAKTRIPRQFAGGPLALCQGANIARRYGWQVGFSKEDHACPSAMLTFGLVPPSPEVARGDIAINLFAKTREGAIKCEEAVVKLPENSLSAIVMAPLAKAEFIPEVIIVYGNPGQIVRLIQGVNYIHGGAMAANFGGRFACSGEFVVPYLHGKSNVIIPGGGEKIFAQTTDDEMAFSFPFSQADEIMEGVIATHKSGMARFPVVQPGLKMRPTFPREYVSFKAHCGLRD